MAQIYYTDSKLMVHQGEIQSTYENWPDYDVLKHTITDIIQVFPDDWMDHAWFYIGPQTRFVRREDPDEHPLLAAAKAEFTPERWIEIRDAIDEQGNISKYLDTLNIAKAKRKAQRARDLGLITTAELQQLSQIVNGS